MEILAFSAVSILTLVIIFVIYGKDMYKRGFRDGLQRQRDAQGAIDKIRKSENEKLKNDAVSSRANARDGGLRDKYDKANH